MQGLNQKPHNQIVYILIVYILIVKFYPVKTTYWVNIIKLNNYQLLLMRHIDAINNALLLIGNYFLLRGF